VRGRVFLFQQDFITALCSEDVCSSIRGCRNKGPPTRNPFMADGLQYRVCDAVWELALLFTTTYSLSAGRQVRTVPVSVASICLVLTSPV
jgi:hypothetical protein